MSKRYFVEGYSGLTWASCSVSLQPIALSYGTAESGLSFTLQLCVGSAPTEVGLPGNKKPKVSGTCFPASYQRSCSEHFVRWCPALPPCIILKDGLHAHIQWGKCCSHTWEMAMSRSHEISTPVEISLSYRAHPAVPRHQNLLQDPQQSAPEELISAPFEFRVCSFLGIRTSWEQYVNQSPVHKNECNARLQRSCETQETYWQQITYSSNKCTRVKSRYINWIPLFIYVVWMATFCSLREKLVQKPASEEKYPGIGGFL